MDKHSEKFLRKRKALMVIPLLALPFVTLAFWALGGGKGDSTQQVQQKQGINTSLPNAQLSATSLDKMSLYNKAAIDSQQLKTQSDNDPFAKDSLLGSDTLNRVQKDSARSAGTNAGDIKAYSDPNEAKVRSKLSELEKTINQPVPQNMTANTSPAVSDNGENAAAELNRLQQSIQAVNQGSTQSDPEMQQLNGMLEKILDIQHPDRVQQQMQEQSLKNRGRVYAVSKPEEQSAASLISRPSGVMTGLLPSVQFNKPGNAFYDLGQAVPEDSIPGAVPAVVQETQTVVSGSTIKMRLTGDVYVNGILIPENTFIFGKCSVDEERLKIEITGIRYNKTLFPVSLSVYDLDALEGIRIPGAISRDASKEGADRAIQSVQLMSLDPSIGTQAAGAGLEAAKGLFSKKVKLIRVTVKAGYPVLLLDEKAKQDTN